MTPVPAMRRCTAIAAALVLAACASSNEEPQTEPSQPASNSQPDEWMFRFMLEFSTEPDSMPHKWKGLIGEYGTDSVNRWFVLERDKRLWVMDQHKYFSPLAEKSDTLFEAPVLPVPVAGEVRFRRDAAGQGTEIRVGNTVMSRRNIEPPVGATQLRITPVRPIEELRREALAAKPPAESGSFRPTELVDVTKLDSTIWLDIRYATENNFLGVKLYDTPRAFLHKPAAEALARASKNARRVGYGLLVHDAYRPWYVTKIFWDATPPEKHWMVANPAQGSRHNRGVAVDITLYDLKTKQIAEMPSTYDESSDRSHSMYPGGTSLQRHHRALLRRVLEHEGFAVEPLEWWHFNYVDRQRYAIQNAPFEQVERKSP